MPKPNAPRNAASDEPDYLAQQTADAEAALANTLADLKFDLAQAADLSRWVRKYPWISVGAAAVTGFAAASAIVPRPEDGAAAAGSPAKEPPKAERNGHAEAQSGKRQAGLSSKLLDTLLDIGKVGMMQLARSAIEGGLHGPGAQAESQQEYDGRARSAPSAANVEL